MGNSTDTARLRELLAKATPGPWRWQMIDEEVLVGPDQVVMRQDEDGLHFAYYGDGTEISNAALIAEAINALPGLLDEVDRLREVEDFAVLVAQTFGPPCNPARKRHEP